MTKGQIENKQEESLTLQDLLIDEQTNVLSEYVSLSIKNLGEDTRITFTTIEDNPIIYLATLSGVAFTRL